MVWILILRMCDLPTYLSPKTSLLPSICGYKPSWTYLQGYPNQNLGFYLIWWFVTTASENWQTPVLYDENQDYVCQIRVPNTIVPTNVFVMCVSVVILCVILCVFLLKLYIFCQLSSIFDIFLNGYRQANRLYYMHVWLSYVSRSMCDLLFQKFARDFF